jgi:hypothetical protein
MAFDPRTRLQRRLPGARLRGEDDYLPACFAREVTEERREVVPPRDRRELLTLTVRRTRRLAEAAPNAPLLIRIVRHPYALHPGGRRRIRWLEQPEAFARVDARAEHAAARDERRRIRWTLPTRPHPFAVRPSSWRPLPPAPEDT